MVKSVFITTKDNPWNPFTHNDEWLEEDTNPSKLNHNTCGLIDRIATVMNVDVEEDKEALEMVIDKIIEEDITDNYVKVYGFWT